MEFGKETYIGDGVYASFDGYHIILRTCRSPGDDHWIALEPEVWMMLHRYVRQLSNDLAEGRLIP